MNVRLKMLCADIGAWLLSKNYVMDEGKELETALHHYKVMCQRQNKELMKLRLRLSVLEVRSKLGLN